MLCKEPLGQEGSTSCEAYNATPSAQDSVHVLILTHDRGNTSLCVYSLIPSCLQSQATWIITDIVVGPALDMMVKLVQTHMNMDSCVPSYEPFAL